MFNKGGAWSWDRESIMTADELTARCAGLHVDVWTRAEDDGGRAHVLEFRPKQQIVRR